MREASVVDRKRPRRRGALIAGATAVQIGTASFYDPLATVKAVDGLSRYLDESGVASITALTGSLDLSPPGRGH